MTRAVALLREARLAAGLTQDELARRAGVTQSVISAYETGRREPSLSTLDRLIHATGARLQCTLITDERQAASPSLPRTGAGALLSRRRRQVLRAAAKHGAHNVRVFGSAARGDDRGDSDIDLLVHLDPDVGLLGLARLRRELEDILGVPVDVVPDEGLKPDVRATVERDLITL